MKKKSPVTIVSAIVTLAAVTAAALSSCTSVEEKLLPPPEGEAVTEPALTDAVTEPAQTETETPQTTVVYAADGSVYEKNASGEMVKADPEDYVIYEEETSPAEHAADGTPHTIYEPEAASPESFYIEEAVTGDSEDPGNFDREPEAAFEDEPAVYAGGEADNVSGEVTGITLSFYETKLNIGDTVMPRVTMFPEDAEDKSEIWASSNEDIAVVDDIGNITAIAPGECIVTVKSADSPEVGASVRVTVKPPVTEPTYINGIIIANKTYALPRDYDPGVNPDAEAAFDKMKQAAADEGLNIYISSGYRSYDYQSGLYDRYVKKSGREEADRYSARPGHSEHQTGLAFDLNTIDWDFEDTPEFDWVSAHCAEYGFIIRYPKGKEDITGYMYEPWHIRYLGKDTAQSVSDSGLTLEEYLGITSVYDE